MAELDQDRRALAERFRVTHAIENALTAQQARLFVRSIQNTWGVHAIEKRDRMRQFMRLSRRQTEGDGVPRAPSAITQALVP